MARPLESTRTETLAAALAILHRASTCRALTMDALAAELGTSKSSAYRWFNSRDLLIVALVSEACDYAETSTRLAGIDADDADVACILRDLIANLPGCLLETRGGKRDQIPTVARERIRICLNELHRYLADVYPAAFALALGAAIATPPSMLPLGRADALAAALDLLSMLAASAAAETKVAASVRARRGADAAVAEMRKRDAVIESARQRAIAAEEAAATMPCDYCGSPAKPEDMVCPDCLEARGPQWDESY